MIRLLNLLAVVGLVASAIYAYSIKYDTLYQGSQVSKLKTALHAERQAIAVLRAEWQLLTRPDRLQAAEEPGRVAALVEQHQRGDVGHHQEDALERVDQPGPLDRHRFQPRELGLQIWGGAVGVVEAECRQWQAKAVADKQGAEVGAGGPLAAKASRASNLGPTNTRLHTAPARPVCPAPMTPS